MPLESSLGAVIQLDLVESYLETYEVEYDANILDSWRILNHDEYSRTERSNFSEFVFDLFYLLVRLAPNYSESREGHHVVLPRWAMPSGSDAQKQKPLIPGALMHSSNSGSYHEPRGRPSRNRGIDVGSSRRPRARSNHRPIAVGSTSGPRGIGEKGG